MTGQFRLSIFMAMVNKTLSEQRSCTASRIIQSNLNSSNTDGSFTMANSNSFFESLLPIAQENKYSIKFSYFIMKLYVACIHQNRLIEAILMRTLNIQLLNQQSERIP